ncbi:hypothetical protein EDC94DRAFT_580294 [Helicostylum pulchrum]|nr:hypothetical protein EDC94DRAFT_580294 [Helicostylum pulchrum]
MMVQTDTVRLKLANSHRKIKEKAKALHVTKAINLFAYQEYWEGINRDQHQYKLRKRTRTITDNLLNSVTRMIKPTSTGELEDINPIKTAEEQYELISGYPIINIDDQRAQVLVGEDVTDQIKAKTTIPAYQLSNFAHKLIKDIEEGCACVKVPRRVIVEYTALEVDAMVDLSTPGNNETQRISNQTKNITLAIKDGVEYLMKVISSATNSVTFDHLNISLH